jgi:hypothetical protein
LVITTAHAAPTFGLLSGTATFITPMAMTSCMPKTAFEDQVRNPQLPASPRRLSHDQEQSNVDLAGS